VVLDTATVKLWADDISTSTSSPILVGDRVFVVSEKGYLYDVDANTGKGKACLIDNDRSGSRGLLCVRPRGREEDRT